MKFTYTPTTKFDIDKLRDHVETYVLPLQSTQQSEAFGGWSVLSSNGSHKDGWHQGHLLYKYPDHPNLDRIRSSGKMKYDVPTEICHGYLKEVVETITSLGYGPRRARLIRLSAQSESAWHRDSPDDKDMYRLHVPIITNDKCFFVREDGQEHMPATGECYLIQVNCMHKVVNLGLTDRIHFVCDIRLPEELKEKMDALSVVGKNHEFVSKA